MEHELATVHVVHDHINFAFGLKGIMESDDVRIANSSQDVLFGYRILYIVRLYQEVLSQHLHRQHLLCLEASHQQHLFCVKVNKDTYTDCAFTNNTNLAEATFANDFDGFEVVSSHPLLDFVVREVDRKLAVLRRFDLGLDLFLLDLSLGRVAVTHGKSHLGRGCRCRAARMGIFRSGDDLERIRKHNAIATIAAVVVDVQATVAVMKVVVAMVMTSVVKPP